MSESDPSIPSPETDPAAVAEDLSTSENVTPVDPLEQAQLDIEKWKDLAYRSQAELDNFRKRATREGQETRAYANSELLRSILPILDNFEMGLNAARAESEKSMIFMGMQMVHRQFQEFLKDFGVQEIESLGKAFDPNLHEAVSRKSPANMLKAPSSASPVPVIASRSVCSGRRPSSWQRPRRRIPLLKRNLFPTSFPTPFFIHG